MCPAEVFRIMVKTQIHQHFFPSEPGGHFWEARRAFFCPRAAGVRIPALEARKECFKLSGVNFMEFLCGDGLWSIDVVMGLKFLLGSDPCLQGERVIS